MKAVLFALVASLRACFRSQASLQLEVLALRNQLAVYQRRRARARVKVADRLLWAWLSRAWAGWRDVLVFVQPSTVIAWQRRRFRGPPSVVEAFPWEAAPRFLLRDRDAVYGPAFKVRVENLGIEEVLTAARSPWQNPLAERVIGSIRRECLEHVIVLDERHLRRLLGEYLYLRRLITSMGAVDLKVPRSREGGSAGGAVFERYKRRSAEVDDTMVAAYVHGASTRDIGQITEALMGKHVSRSTVSRAAKTLGTKVEDLRKAPIEGPIPYLFLDATFLDARWAREVENVSALVAYGVGLDGHRQLLAITIGAEESEASWTDLLAQLNERGLSGVQLVIADAHAGLAKAVRHHLPEAPLQRCVVHLQRNIVGKAPQRLSPLCQRE